MKIKNVEKLTEMPNVTTPIKNKEYNSAVLGIMTNIQNNLVIENDKTKSKQFKQNMIIISIIILTILLSASLWIILETSNRYDYYY